MTADVWDLGTVPRFPLESGDRSPEGLGARNNERIGVETALQQLFSFKGLQKVLNGKNLPDKSNLNCVRNWK